MTMRGLLLALLASFGALAEPVVIVNAKNPTPSISRETARRLLLGEDLEWPSGQAAEVIELRNDDPAVSAGYLELAHKTVAQVRALWNRLVFSGQANPPARFTTAADAIGAVGRRPWALAIVDRSAVDSSVKVALSLIEAGAR